MSEQPRMWRDWDWILGTAFNCIKEFTAVLFQLVCYSRMNNYDFFNGSLVLFTTLIVFGFPFMSPSLFATLRLGPWNVAGTWAFAGTCIQTGLIIGFQLLGAFAGAKTVVKYNEAWNLTSKSVISGGVDAMYTGTDGKEDPGWDLLEEMIAQTCFLIGLIHIIESSTPGSLTNAAWQATNKAKKSKEEEDLIEKIQDIETLSNMQSTENQILDNTNKVLKQLQKLSKRIKQTNPPKARLSVSNQTGSANTDTSADSTQLETSTTDAITEPTPDGISHQPIPLELILYASLLVAGITRAFPSAHQSIHISLYLYCTDHISSEVCSYRIGGGILATFLALMYYHFVYRWRNSDNRFIKPVNTAIIERPAFMRSKLVLPTHLKQ